MKEKTILRSLTAACMLVPATLAASDQGGPLYIRAATVFTGVEVLENAVVVVEGARITAVGTEIVVPDGARILQHENGTILPGLIDGHVHFMGTSLEYVSEINRRGFAALVEQSMSRQPNTRREYLLRGVTTIMDMGDIQSDIDALRAAAKAGRLISPDLFTSGPMLTAPGGHPAGDLYKGQHRLEDHAVVQLTEKDDVEASVRRVKDGGADYVKLIYDDGVANGKPMPRLAEEVATRIVAEARRLGVKVFAHAGTGAGHARSLAAWGVDGIEHSFPSDEGDGVFAAMATASTIFTPTLSVFHHLSPGGLAEAEETVRRAFEAGVTIVAGTDFPNSLSPEAGSDMYLELRLLEEAGLPRLEAVKAATLNAAGKLGAKDRGRIEPGALADLVLFEGDIREGALTEDRVSGVMLHGEAVVVEGVIPEEKVHGFAVRRWGIPTPFGGYTESAGVFLGLSAQYYNPLNSGAAAFFTGMAGFSNDWRLSLALSTPSPFAWLSSPATALYYDTFPLSYYGLSNDATGDAWIALDRLSIGGSLSGKVDVTRHLRIPLRAVFEYQSFSSRGAEPLPEATGMAGGFYGIFSTGLEWDTRDNSVDPWSGMYALLSADGSTRLLGSAADFLNIAVDGRGFLSLLHRQILAGRLLFEASFGDAPFNRRPSFGGSVLGRGYSPGRFIGRYGAFAQVELRSSIWGPFGAAAFLDAGQVRDAIQDFTLEGFHFGYGAGIRLNFSDYLILSFDFGFGADGGLRFCFNAGNAF